MVFIWFYYGFYMISYGFYMISYGFHMISSDFYMILYAFYLVFIRSYMISYGFYLILHGFHMILCCFYMIFGCVAEFSDEHQEHQYYDANSWRLGSFKLSYVSPENHKIGKSGWWRWRRKSGVWRRKTGFENFSFDENWCFEVDL